ncbi:thioredoxin-like protein [Atractiella rhizophila]|nr:thioredoxin-like protein [Atractiella rhizophila]
MKPSQLASFLLLAAPGSVLAGLFGPKSPVKMLTGKTFSKFVQGSDKASIAAFVAPWCGHCQRLTPEFEKAASNLKGLVNVELAVAVDCDDDANKRFCAEQGVQGYPTIKTFGGGKSKAQDYQGPRTAKAIVDDALSHMPSFAKKIKSPSALDQVLVPSSRPKSILFTPKSSPSPLYRALSSEFHKGVDFYFCRR